MANRSVGGWMVVRKEGGGREGNCPIMPLACLITLPASTPLPTPPMTWLPPPRLAGRHTSPWNAPTNHLVFASLQQQQQQPLQPPLPRPYGSGQEELPLALLQKAMVWSDALSRTSIRCPSVPFPHLPHASFHVGYYVPPSVEPGDPYG